MYDLYILNCRKLISIYKSCGDVDIVLRCLLMMVIELKHLLLILLQEVLVGVHGGEVLLFLFELKQLLGEHDNILLLILLS